MPPRRHKPSDEVLSLKTKTALKKENFGVSYRDEVKCTQLIGQFLEEYFCKYKSITSGGMAEGTALENSSDSDVMGVINGIIVVDDYLKGDESKILIEAIRKNCYPGYCKLKISTEQRRKLISRKHTSEPYPGIVESIVDREGLYISSKKFSQHVVPCGMIPADNIYHKSFNVNGPAVRNNNVDFVQAFEMDEWPKEARAWRTRRRDTNWPSEELLSRLEADIACYVVAVGNKSSPDDQMEWRLSFVEIERELIWSMNETQFQCFVILKRLGKKFMTYPCLKDITTYHLKNIIFWKCEALCDWVPRNLIKYVKDCLKMLELCMKEGKLNHYIIPENNLFKDKNFISKEITKTMTRLRENDFYNLMGEICNNGKILSDLLLVEPEIVGHYDRCGTVFWYCSSKYDPQFRWEFRKKFPEAKILLPCINLVQAETEWRLNLNHTFFDGEHDKNYLFQDMKTLAESFIYINKIKGYEIDFATITIKSAIVHFMHGNYHEVLMELKPLLSERELKIYVSSLGRPVYLCFRSGAMHANRIQNVGNVKDLESERNKLVTDFMTRQADIHNENGYYTNALPYPFELQVFLSTARDAFFITQ